MSNIDFWANVDTFLAQAKKTSTAQELIDLMHARFPNEEYVQGDAFFPGSGGDGKLSHSLREAGWLVKYIEGSYWWGAKAANGDIVEYIEGDVYIR